MHLLLETRHSHSQEGKEEDMRDLRVEINRLITYCSKIISRKYITQYVKGIIYPRESLMHWLLLPETYEESVRFICKIVM